MEKVLDKLLAIRDESKEFHIDEDINDIIQFHINNKDVDVFSNKKGRLRNKFEHILCVEQWSAVAEILRERRRQKLKDEFLTNGRLLHSTEKCDKKLD